MIAHEERSDTDVGEIDCPNCGEGSLAAVVVRDEDTRPAVVCCLACRQLFRAETAGWRQPRSER